MCADHSPYTYRLKLITPDDHPRRGVAFLISDKDVRITAEAAFKALSGNIERWFRTIFDAWIDGKTNPMWFHGWNASAFKGGYTDCFVFKKQEGKKSSHHFYGFLCHPKASSPAYLFCVLVVYVWKTQFETDEANLRRVTEISAMPAVQEAIKKYFKERS